MSVRDFQWDQKKQQRAGRITAALGVSTLMASLALAAPPSLPGQKAGARGFGVSISSPTAARDAAKILKNGGSAADGAIVAALVAGVTSPTSSGIGGGGFAVGWDAKTKRPFVLDFRERGPRELKREAFERRPLDRKEKGQLIGVPGEVRGLFELHKRAGKLPWAQLVKKAAFRAHNGFTVGQHLGNMLIYGQKKLKDLPGFSSIYYRGGKPALVGSRMTHPALGRTLDKIAAEGPDGFYKGEVAADIVETAQAYGGKLSLDDLKEYRVVEREALRIAYGEYEVYTMPPPSAGGLMMAQVLTMYPADYLRNLGHGSSAYQHLLAEAMRAAVADRMRYLSDPDFEKVDLKYLLSDSRLEKRRSTIALDRTHGLPRFGLEEEGTQALVTSDREGNVVSLTTTVNHLFGSKIYAQKSGIALNNELSDFSSREAVAPFSMTETPNHARPLARPVSSMTPTIVVKDGRAALALGGSGGTAIATNAVQTLLAALVFDHSPKKAVSADRIYIPTKGAHIKVEKGTSKERVKGLERRGEIVDVMHYSSTAIQMLRLDGPRVQGAADARKFGLAIVGK